MVELEPRLQVVQHRGDPAEEKLAGPVGDPGSMTALICSQSGAITASQYAARAAATRRAPAGAIGDHLAGGIRHGQALPGAFQFRAHRLGWPVGDELELVLDGGRAAQIERRREQGSPWRGDGLQQRGVERAQPLPGELGSALVQRVHLSRVEHVQRADGLVDGRVSKPELGEVTSGHPEFDHRSPPVASARPMTATANIRTALTTTQPRPPVPPTRFVSNRFTPVLVACPRAPGQVRVQIPGRSGGWHPQGRYPKRNAAVVTLGAEQV